MFIAALVVAVAAANAQNDGVAGDNYSYSDDYDGGKYRYHISNRRDLTYRLANRGYMNIAITRQFVEDPVYGYGRESNRPEGIGVAISRNRNYVLHSRPILGLYMGIDVTWLDLAYAKVKQNIYRHHGYPDVFSSYAHGHGYRDRDYEELAVHNGDISMGIGPSLGFFPIGRLGLHAYAKYNPTFATRISNYDDFSLAGGYASVFSAGGAVSLGFLSLGAEARFGTGKYKQIIGDAKGTKYHLDTSTSRFYISFRY